MMFKSCSCGTTTIHVKRRGRKVALCGKRSGGTYLGWPKATCKSCIYILTRIVDLGTMLLHLEGPPPTPDSEQTSPSQPTSEDIEQREQPLKHPRSSKEHQS